MVVVEVVVVGMELTVSCPIHRLRSRPSEATPLLSQPSHACPVDHHPLLECRVALEYCGTDLRALSLSRSFSPACRSHSP